MKTKFYSRRMTNDMRNDIKNACKNHMQVELTKTPTFIEMLENFSIIQTKVMEEFYKVIPESDYQVLLKYPKTLQHYTLSIGKYTDDHYKEFGIKYTGEYYSTQNRQSLKMCPTIRIPDFWYRGEIEAITTKAYTALGIEFMDQFYDQYYLIECEKDSAVVAIQNILKQFSTTGKLIAAYPTFEKFIPDMYKTPENRDRAPVTTKTAKEMNVDIHSLLG